MKFVRQITAASAFALLISSCGHEPLGSIGKETDGENIVCASLEQPDGTKTTLASNGTEILWSENDSFVAFGANGEAAQFTLIAGAGTGCGQFSGTFAGGEPYTLLYPYSGNASLEEGWLHFELPQEQTYVASTFAAGSNPTVATCTTGGNVQFRNLCGVLKITTKGWGQQLEKIVLRDLAGNMLWGNASVKIDGKQGTADQTMVLEGGDNTLTLKMNNITINTNISKTFYFIVPAGALDRGFALAFYTIKGNVYGFLETQVDNMVRRSGVIDMPLTTTSKFTESADAKARGFHKDLFMDSGISLTSYDSFYAADYIGLSMEYFKSNNNTYLNKTDTLLTKQLFFGSEEDENGVLLYPDGEPRFRIIYMNGGNSRIHGAALYGDGTKNIQTFFKNGGSYTGSCAGSFYPTKGYDSNYPYIYYASLWPGHAYHTRTDSKVAVENAYTNLSVEPGCPLLNYYLKDTMVYHVYHNGGSYIKPTDSDFPAGTEILMRYSTPGKDSTKLNGSVNAWAYKPSETSGRLVVSGSHPEKVSSGRQLYYMASMVAYALDGVAPPDVKPIALKSVSEGLIGDNQYHHYKFTLDSKVENVRISLSSDVNADLFLTLRKDSLAFVSDAQYSLTTTGAKKTLDIKSLEAGEWYIGVLCATTVETERVTYSPAGAYYKYTGRTDILNGVAYTLSTSNHSIIPSEGGEVFENKYGEWN